MLRASFLAALLSAASWIAIGACSGGGPNAMADAGPDTESSTDVDSDTDSDADSDGDSDTGPPIPAECPTALVPPCDDELYELPLIVTAEHFGEGYRFVDATEWVLVAERETDAGNEIAVIRRRSGYTWYWDDPAIATVMVGAGHAVAAFALNSGEYDDSGDATYATEVLVCYLDGACDVFEESRESDGEAWTDETSISGVPRWSLPSWLAAREFRASATEVAIAVGDGAVALTSDGGIFGLVAAGSGDLLSCSTADGWLVGAGGRLVRNTSGEWASEEVDAGTSADLLSAASDDDFFRVSIAAADGNVGAGDPYEGLEWAAIATEPVVEIVNLPDRLAGGRYALTASGCAVRTEYEEFCVDGVVPSPATRIVGWRCWDALNIDYLAPDGLYGYWDCYHIM